MATTIVPLPAALSSVLDQNCPATRMRVTLSLDLASIYSLIYAGLLTAGTDDPLWAMLLGRALRFPVVHVRPTFCGGDEEDCQEWEWGRQHYVAQINEHPSSLGIGKMSAHSVLMRVFTLYQHCAVQLPDIDYSKTVVELRNEMCRMDDLLEVETERANELEQTNEGLLGDIDSIAHQRDELEAERDELAAERDELRCRLEELEERTA